MIRAFQWDLARQVERLDWLLAQLPRYAAWGYNELYLHLEDAVEYPSLPAVARRDAYSHRQLGRLVEAAARANIRVVPIVNLLGHTQYLIKVPELRDLNELRAPDGSPRERGQICPLHPRTLEIAEKLLRDMAPFCTAGKVHVGLDESFHLGQHPLSQREIADVGPAAHFAGHVQRLHALTASLDLKMGMWADMFYFLPAAIPLLPPDVAAYEWYYHKFARRPRVELFNFAESDVGEQLRARGVEYWGCPMNGAFRYELIPHFTDRLQNIRSWWRQCRRMQATGFLVTSWESNRLAQELTTVVDAAAASLWLDGETLAPSAMLERGFARVFGKSSAKAAARAALASDKFPFSGYPRWEINDRWDVISKRESLRPYRRESAHFRQLARVSKTLPLPLKASVQLRHYAAVRDGFVRNPSRRAATGFETAIEAGLRAARAMWASTRHSRTRGPNEAILLRDLARLRAWKKGEPVFGDAWQLCYRVNNFAPAAQLVAVEQRVDGESWKPIQACHTIEFQSRAARPSGGLTREHAAPVQWDGDPAKMPKLRFALRGLGHVRIQKVELRQKGVSWRAKFVQSVFGEPAPRNGFPNLDWSKNQSTLPVKFAARPTRATRPNS